MRVRLYTILISLFWLTVNVAVNGGNTNSVSDPQNQSINNMTLQGSGNFTIRSSSSLVVSGEKPVNVGDKGSITLVAGKAIHLLPGTKISAGGFMYASINGAAKKGKAIHKVAKLVTVEENARIEEQSTLAEAVKIFGPFVTQLKNRQISSPGGEKEFIGSDSRSDSVLPNESNNRSFTLMVNSLIIETVPIVRNYILKMDFCCSSMERRFVLRL